MLETVISLGLLASVGLARPTKDVYRMPEQTYIGRDIQTYSEAQVGATFMSALPLMATPSYVVYELPIAADFENGRAKKDDLAIEVIAAIDTVGLPQEVCVPILSAAKGFLADCSFSTSRVVPIVAVDPEEGVSYLTLQLEVDTDFETSLELDYQVTRRLVSAFAKIPSELSISVTNCEGAIA